MRVEQVEPAPSAPPVAETQKKPAEEAETKPKGKPAPEHPAHDDDLPQMPETD